MVETAAGASTGASCAGLVVVQMGPLPQGWGPFHHWANVFLQRLVRLSATVRLHASVGKKDGQTFTPNEEMKLDCQDLSGLVLTRCRLFKCLCDYMLSVSLCVGSLQFH